MVGGPGQIEALGDLGAPTGLGDELHLGLEEVHVQPKHPVQLAQGLELGGRVVAGVAHALAHHGPVLLLDVAVVVLAVGP